MGLAGELIDALNEIATKEIATNNQYKKVKRMVAEFEKVSFEQFKEALEKFYGSKSEDESADRKIYDTRVKLPVRKTSGSAGYDFFCPFNVVVPDHGSVTIPTGIRCNILDEYFLSIHIRSSLGIKYGITLANGTGIIDSDYYDADNEGHIFIKLTNNTDEPYRIDAGDAIAQGVFLQYFLSVDDDVKEKRTGGIGSTGK